MEIVDGGERGMLLHVRDFDQLTLSIGHQGEDPAQSRSGFSLWTTATLSQIFHVKDMERRSRYYDEKLGHVHSVVYQLRILPSAPYWRRLWIMQESYFAKSVSSSRETAFYELREVFTAEKLAGLVRASSL